MTYKLWDAARALARKLEGSWASGTATSNGLVTTLVDSTRTEPDDMWNGGTLFLGNCTQAAIDYSSRVVSDFTQSSGTITVAPALSAITTSGDPYVVASADYPRYALWWAINEAYKELAPYDTDMTTTTVANQQDYTLPSGVYGVKRVEISSQTSSPYHWRIHSHWSEVDGVLRFHEGAIPDMTGYYIRIWYQAVPTELDADDDTITDSIHIDVLTWLAARFCYQWRISRREGDAQYLALLEARANANYMAAKQRHPLPNPKPTPTLGAWLSGSYSEETDEFTIP